MNEKSTTQWKALLEIEGFGYEALEGDPAAGTMAIDLSSAFDRVRLEATSGYAFPQPVLRMLCGSSTEAEVRKLRGGR